MDKKTLRSQIKVLKKQYSNEELDKMSENILARLEENVHFKNAVRVMLYSSLPDEVRTHDFIAKWRKIKTIILPTVVGDDIIPVALNDETSFQKGDFDILEPQDKPYEGGYDLIVVPGVAFDANGNRLGRGRGYYDRFLDKNRDVYRVGICFDFQKVEEVPSEPHDIKMNEII